MVYRTHTLNNGLRIIYKPEDIPVCYCGMVINTGTRDELPEEHGMAHFVEHMLFKGTQNRRASHIINRLENVGGELNAFTSKEETVVYATVLKEHAHRAVELITDIVFYSVFPQKEIEKEKVIVLDEIQSYNDSPSELIYDDYEEQLFRNHALGHSILGKQEIIENFDTEKLLNFVQNKYATGEMVFFVLGNLNFDKLIKQLEAQTAQSNFPLSKPAGTQPNAFIPETRVINKDTHQIHFILGNRAYDLQHPDRMGLYLLNNILGGPGMNSMLNLSLREKHALVYHVDSSFQPMTDTGLWCVYFGTDPENTSKCEKLVLKSLDYLRENRMKDQLLNKYKMQLMGQMAIASENKENFALSLGKSFLRYGKIDDIETIRMHINNVTTEQLQRIANEVFNPEKFSILKYT